MSIEQFVNDHQLAVGIVGLLLLNILIYWNRKLDEKGTRR